MKLLERLENYYLLQYRNSDYLAKTKSRIFLYLLLISVISAFSIYISLVIVGLPMWYWHITIPVMMLVPVISLYLLRKGNIFQSANLFTMVLSLITLIGMYFRFRVNPADVYITTFNLVAIIILGSSIFCKIQWLYIYSSLFLLADVILFVMARENAQGAVSAVFGQGFIYTCMNVVTIFWLSLFIRFTTNKALKNVNEELYKNMELNRSLDDKHKVIQRLSDGLNQHLNTLNDNSAKFAESSEMTASSIEEISSTSEEVMSGVDQVFSVVDEQRNNLIMLLESIQRLSLISGEISEQVNMVNASTAEITTMAEQGSNILMQLHSGMTRISDSSKVMGDIVAMINDVADKINLLSLNASIEAARAGAMGKGFAVVANEISRLGNVTQERMNEINRLILDTNSDINSGLVSVDTTVTAFTRIIETINRIIGEINGISLKTRTQRDINGIVNSESEKLRSMAEQIKDMMEMQQVAINEIIKSITNINETTQAYVVESRRLQADAKEIEQLAVTLNHEVNI